ncbi:MAG: hypothetical protein GEU78_08185 [Actinobacteria bacterium]|nr:hypothetical protein [Actinomycetota bacterium]
MVVKDVEKELLPKAMAILRDRLPPDWSVEEVMYNAGSGQADNLWEIRGPSSSSRGLIVEARASLSPRDVQLMLGGGLLKRLRAVGGDPILVVAPFVSPRSRELLVEEDVNYLDLTGNLRLVLSNPAVFLETRGADQNPFAKPRRARGLRGAKVGSVIRVLVDARPPYGVTEIADAARVTPGYVTRILETLSAEALIERGAARGQVIDVNWQGLIRRRAEALDLLAPHTSSLYIAPNGARAFLQELRGEPEEKFVVTGSFAAVRLAPIAAPALLVLFTPSANKDRLAGRLNLLPAPEGGDVALVRPENTNVYLNVREEEGLLWAAPSQVAIDCLSGSGRMPSEGEALIAWMADNEKSWRSSSLSDLKMPEWVPG